MLIKAPWGNYVGTESKKTWWKKYHSDFFDKYMSGKGLDIGFAGYTENTKPILPNTIGVDLNYPGYDGKTLPFESESQDYLYSSHCLEHVSDRINTIKEWYRVVRKGGHLIIVVPHRDLYERKTELPSHWNEDHKVFYTSSSLLKEIEDALPINSYRIRHLHENDDGHIYGVPVEIHASGEYEIEVVLEKL
jgi:SAM-dependent methyltransferase